MNYVIQSFDYFYFNGVKYAKGTEIELTDYAYDKYGIKFTNKPYVVFMHQNKNCQEIYCLIKEFSYISIPNDSDHIKKIVKPMYYKEISSTESAIKNYSEKKKTPDLFDGCLWYLFIMIFLIIFKNGILYMIITTAFFIRWLINKYRD